MLYCVVLSRMRHKPLLLVREGGGGGGGGGGREGGSNVLNIVNVEVFLFRGSSWAVQMSGEEKL